MGNIPSRIQKLLVLQLEAARHGIASMSPSQLADYVARNDEIEALLFALQAGRKKPQQASLGSNDPRFQRPKR